MKLSGWILSSLALLALALAGCNSQGLGDGRQNAPSPGHAPYAGKYPIRALATTGMVVDLVKHVGGDHVEVEYLMRAGVDPHLYRASASDVAKLEEVDIIFYSGLHLEGKMSDLFVRMAGRKPTFAVTAAIPEKEIIEHSDGAFDPHVWFDVHMWSEAVDSVRDALCEFDPPHADEYRANAKAYQAELAKLHDDCREQLATIPAERRVLVTAHDAFHYFGRAYALEVKAIQGISTDSEAGVLEINELVKFIVDRKIKAVFVESSVPKRNIEAVVKGCESQGHAVVIGGELFSDAMGEAGTPDGTYVGMVKHNVDMIVKALK